MWILSQPSPVAQFTITRYVEHIKEKYMLICFYKLIVLLNNFHCSAAYLNLSNKIITFPATEAIKSIYFRCTKITDSVPAPTTSFFLSSSPSSIFNKHLTSLMTGKQLPGWWVKKRGNIL